MLKYNLIPLYIVIKSVSNLPVKYNPMHIFVPEANDIKDKYDSINFMVLNNNLVEIYPTRLITNYACYISPKLIDVLLKLKNSSIEVNI
jgi:hypothetical protein